MTPYVQSLSTLLAAIPLGIQECDLNGVITYSNPAHHKMLGYEDSEIIGRTIFDMVHTPEQRKALEEYLVYLAAEPPEPTPYIAVSYRKDGSPLPTKTDWNYLFSETGQLSGFISVVSDFSEHQNLEERLRQERDLLHLYLNAAQFMVLVLDANGNISLVNRALCQALGYTAKQLIGKNWFKTCVPDEQRDMIFALFKDMIIGKAEFMESYDSYALTSSGEPRLISWHNSEQHDADGKVCGYICSGEDITKRRETEREKLQLQDELRRSQKIEAIARLTGGIAHDFNNILASILGYSDMALDAVTEQGDIELQRFLSEVISEAEKARDLIKQMQAFSRANPDDLLTMPPAPLIKETVKALQTTLPTPYKILLNAEEQVPDIELPPAQLQQLLQDLVNNSIKGFTEGKDHLISITLGTANLDRFECPTCQRLVSGQFVEITVTDDGPGISPDELKDIFSPLPSIKETNTGRTLALVKKILHDNQGHILLDSTPGYGLSVRLLIPAAGATPNQWKATAASSTETQNYRVMIVDDEESIAHLTGELLATKGCRADVFSDSIKALRNFQQQPEQYGCVLIKRDMPSLNGIDFSEQLLQQRPELAILLFVPKQDETAHPELLEKGNIQLLSKPITADKLTALICQILDQQR